MDQVKSEVRAFLKEDPFYADTIPRDFADEYPLLDSGVLDSIGIFNLIVFVESKFSIRIGIDELSEAHFANLNQIEMFIKSKIQISNGV